MTNEYWNQWNCLELASLHGIEIEYDCVIEKANDDDASDDKDHHEPMCPYCTGRGCNWCLMLNW